VLVDYAHTDDALLNVLSAVRAVVGSGRIITLFGCGGDRDRSKRPRMMRIAAERSEIVIVTSDNPRTEDPNAILSEILAGAPEACSARIEAEVDRALAIRRAVSLARPGDIVLIAGKGHEDYQIIGRQKRSFDDRIHAREALAALQTKSALQGVSA
jgi:UDP-N-acetylmuramoyl-L-alanyl-D-glutamate--2,6-diaminopimelate ligase